MSNLSGEEGVTGEAEQELEEADIDPGQNLEGLVCRRVHDFDILQSRCQGVPWSFT